MDSGDQLDNLNKGFHDQKPESKYVNSTESDFSQEPNGLNEKIGECIIFNYEVYEKHMKLTKRCASKHDADSLKHVFTELKFNVHEAFTSLSQSDTLDALKNVSSNIPENSKDFVCCILTHGNSTDMLATRNRWLDLNEFLCYFYPTTCKNLSGKPKIFIIQACRGGDGEKAVKMESTDLATEYELYPDFIIAYSTYPGTVSFNNSDCGSFFIQEFCNCFECFSSDQDLLQILTVVNHHIANFFVSRSKEPKLNEKRQMPNFTSTLTSQISFQQSIEPYESDGRRLLNERRARSRLDATGEKYPYHDLKSYSIPTPGNVLFFEIQVENGINKNLSEQWKEAAACLSVYIKEKKYQYKRTKKDLKKSKILDCIESFASGNYANAVKCVICFIATPSKREYLLDKDGRKISKPAVIEKFIKSQHSSLVGKPKIFIFLMYETNVPMESTDLGEGIDSHFIAEHADILYITISIKKQEDLLAPTYELTKHLKERGSSEDLLTSLTSVNSILNEKYNFHTKKPRSTFSFNSTMTQNVILP